MNGRSQHVAVVGIGELQRGNEGLVAGDKGIESMLVHQLPGSLQLLTAEVRAHLEEVAYPLLVDCIRPGGTVETREGQVHEQVAQRRRVKHASVVEDSAWH